ncbi:MAG TPA: glycosyltransferase [Bacteroidia bacterium]|jgi:glycosyltransferase involved in cell wall biosynthesis|nr:glycosyltransferase [Bacteroidia bacterium]
MDPMMKLDHALFIFTQEYPYGKGETFIENELIELSPQFDTIYLFPLKKTSVARQIPIANANVVTLFENECNNKWGMLLSNFFVFTGILVNEWKALGFSKFSSSFSSLKSILLLNLHRAKVLNQYIQSGNIKQVSYYSFWTDDWATILSILTLRKQIVGFVSRVHGYDLYEYRWPSKLIPFRNFQLKQVSKIIAASKDGLNYLKKHYPVYENKFFLQHLNVFDKGLNPFDSNDSEFTIVSCSNIISLKRVHLIPELLKENDLKIRWIHFGDGDKVLEQQLKEDIAKLPTNISVELRGYISNPDLIRFYQTNKVNLFIHLSETEGGVPLVLQEVASFGIPMLATDVGGIPEIVNEETGILIPANFSKAEAAEKIKTFASSPLNTPSFRANVKSYWDRFFNAKENSIKLYNLLVQK